MKRHRPKHRIYTFSLRNKRQIIILAMIIFFAVLFLDTYSKAGVEDGIYSFLYSHVYDNTVELKTGGISGIKKSIFAPDMIMRHGSAVFTNDTKHQKNDIVNASKTASSKKISGSKPRIQSVIEDSIVSEGLDIKNETTYEIDAQNMAGTYKNYDVSGDIPKVLIIHTHACETYSDNNGNGLGSVGTYRTQDESKNMIAVGESICGILTQNGIKTIHDKTLCDYPVYNDSYVNSLGIIEWYLERYPSLEFVFDIHRDAISTDDGVPKKLVYKSGKETTAQLMIVCGTDGLGLSHPAWRENLTLALKIQKQLELDNPGIMRPLNLRKERFNMHKTKGSLLFEVGTHGNTLIEAKKAAEYLAAGIVKVLKNNH